MKLSQNGAEITLTTRCNSGQQISCEKVSMVALTCQPNEEFTVNAAAPSRNLADFKNFTTALSMSHATLLTIDLKMQSCCKKPGKGLKSRRAPLICILRSMNT